MLIVPAQFGVDIFSEAERILEKKIDFVVLSSVVDELKRNLTSISKTENRIFRIALDLVKRCRVIEPEELNQDILVDDMILNYAIAVSGVIATNDRDLRERALSRKIPVLFLRGKKQLQLVGCVI